RNESRNEVGQPRGPQRPEMCRPGFGSWREYPEGRRSSQRQSNSGMCAASRAITFEMGHWVLRFSWVEADGRDFDPAVPRDTQRAKLTERLPGLSCRVFIAPVTWALRQDRPENMRLMLYC